MTNFWRLTFFLSSLFISKAVNAQSDYVVCLCDSAWYAQDEIFQKINFGQPTLYIQRDTLGIDTASSFKLQGTIYKSMTVWVNLIFSDGNQIKLFAGHDFTYNCELREITIVHRAIIPIGTVIEISWVNHGNCE